MLTMSQPKSPLPLSFRGGVADVNHTRCRSARRASAIPCRSTWVQARRRPSATAGGSRSAARTISHAHLERSSGGFLKGFVERTGQPIAIRIARINGRPTALNENLVPPEVLQEVAARCVTVGVPRVIPPQFGEGLTAARKAGGTPSPQRPVE